MNINEVMDDSFDYAAQREYFKSAEIFQPRARMARMSLASEQQGSDSAAVLGTTVAAYDEELSYEDREAFDDTILYAEIRADKLFYRETQRREWYAEYSKALTMCGWPTMSDPYKEYISRELNFTLDEAALQIIALAAGADKLKVLPLISAAFNSLEKNDGALKLIELKSKQNKSGNFQATPCLLLGGRATMIACAIQMEAKELITKFLFFKYRGEEVRIYNAATRRVLNRRAYNVVKDVVQAAVDKARLNYFKTPL
ncbi:hypothetical protein [Pseudomonas fluorescens]|jgi:hypothetical protein|uniref:Uncharacterized protein n=1 Tax=Pseudomonas fluorescens TaxID=294 RepID=A0A5E7NYD1_PSEFL|nr:hypothetical protein [Pseudomonas fluorescens]VVP42416.1 hypothetical protein PS854_04892 [Pseudomonas fluorescens]